MTNNSVPQDFTFEPELREAVKKNIRLRGLEESVVDANVNAFINEQTDREIVCSLNGLIDYLFATFPDKLNAETLQEYILKQIKQEDERLKASIDSLAKSKQEG